MSLPVLATADDPHAERWRQWQASNEVSNRKGAMHARIVFALIFAALTAAAISVPLFPRFWA